MYISVFRWGVKIVAKLSVECENKSPLRVIAGKKQCAMPSIAASFVAAKRSFSRRFAWSRRHKFSYLRNFHRFWSSRRCFWCWLRAVWAISGSRPQLRSRHRSVSCDRVDVSKPKLRNFDRPLGLPGHHQWSFWRRQRAISSKYDGAGARQLPPVTEQHSWSCRRKQTIIIIIINPLTAW